MKTFNKQYCECSEAGFQGVGELKKFKDRPELLPALWHRTAQIVADKLKNDPDFGLTTVACLRFGGECSSKNEECRKLRGLTE